MDISSRTCTFDSSHFLYQVRCSLEITIESGEGNFGKVKYSVKVIQIDVSYGHMSHLCQFFLMA